ncbi:methyltransferase domain-containing protein [Pelagicoccus sp. SDUM812002]|uniref:methyltransferase domain-containing protein n=1 Tax=Pelagicoccus sp. SDUM812002 TaxID=3041266 RepID=UPI00280CAB0E|nr:methyltransferase domain-containing protein [Pelagicoccus sp. SDUM812002]MDQ8186290.1 methyltransferase domain-containing protein [Pelagicoccus sp. SDUM812002]
MNWKIKSAIQNGVASLPSGVSYELYYWIQRRFGNLKVFNPEPRLGTGVWIWNLISSLDQNPSDKVFLEVGTGRAPIVPLSLWLLGAKKTYTYDANPYLKLELIRESLRHIQSNHEQIRSIYGEQLMDERFESLSEFSKSKRYSIDDFLQHTQIEYVAPGDASDTGLTPDSIDYHISYTVFEHVPPSILRSILREGARIIKKDGLFIHRIDYSDHFSHSDKKISAANFLKYSDSEWEKLAGNRYMYMNRLRHDDYIELFTSNSIKPVSVYPTEDKRSLRLLQSGEITPDNRFHEKTNETLSIRGASIIARKEP